MKIQLHSQSFLIHYTVHGKTQSKFWDGYSMLALGHPTRFVLQRKEKEVFVRDFSSKNQGKVGLTKFSLTRESFGKKLSLSEFVKDEITIQPLTKFVPVSLAQANKIPPVRLSLSRLASVEDKLFQKYLKQFMAASAVAVLLMLLIKPSETPKEEELIPKKYAKLIMTKPKEKLHAPAASAAAASQAAVKAVARAMQSKTVQKSISSILKGGLTKYSIMNTGRSIQSLTQKIQGSTNMSGTVLQGKASDILAANHVGSTQVGSANGYGAGTGIAVKGQGNGQLEIGLNTQDATVDEGLTKEEVAKVIHAHLSEIRFCYESAILKDPTLAGKVMIDFKINPTGLVGASKVSEATIADNAVGSCLVSHLRTWPFPHPRGGVMVAVSYPFIFKSLSR